MTTKQLVEEYFDSVADDPKAEYMRGHIDVPALYKFEEERGKPLLQMNTEEIIELTRRLVPETEVLGIRYMGRYTQVFSRIKAMFSYYSDNYELIRNPCDSKAIRGNKLMEVLNNGKPHLNTAYLYSVIDECYQQVKLSRAKFYELIMLMFYCGFTHGSEILSFKEENINRKTKQIFLKDRFVQLNDRCYDLLFEVHLIPYLEGQGTQTFDFRPYNGSFFMLPTPKDQIDFDRTNSAYVANTIHQYITTAINKVCGSSLSYVEIFYLGLYDHLVGVFGKEKMAEMIRNPLARNAGDEFVEAAEKFGFKGKISYLRKRLTPFLEDDVEAN